jgi:hypothetical protein
LHKHNLNFKIKPCQRWDKTSRKGCVQGIWCTKEI